MKHNKKLNLPKIKKKIHNFLTDESGKIAKKDALGIGIGSAILLGASVGEVSWAAHCSNVSHANQAHGSGYLRNGHLSGTAAATVNQSSVNGHWSGTPSAWHQSGYIRGWHASQAAINTQICNWSHANHGNHGNHGNHSNGWHSNY